MSEKRRERCGQTNRVGEATREARLVNYIQFELTFRYIKALYRNSVEAGEIHLYISIYMMCENCMERRAHT